LSNVKLKTSILAFPNLWLWHYYMDSFFPIIFIDRIFDNRFFLSQWTKSQNRYKILEWNFSFWMNNWFFCCHFEYFIYILDVNTFIISLKTSFCNAQNKSNKQLHYEKLCPYNAQISFKSKVLLTLTKTMLDTM